MNDKDKILLKTYFEILVTNIIGVVVLVVICIILTLKGSLISSVIFSLGTLCMCWETWKTYTQYKEIKDKA